MDLGLLLHNLISRLDKFLLQQWGERCAGAVGGAGSEETQADWGYTVMNKGVFIYGLQMIVL